MWRPDGLRQGCAPSDAALAEHGGGQQAGADGDHDRDEAVERRQAVGEGVQVALQPLALQREAHR